MNHGKRPPGGRTIFPDPVAQSVLPDSLPGQGADNAILANTLALQRFRTARVTLVSKDINLRIKASILGVHAEDYSSDKTIEDADLLANGVQQLPPNFWEKHGKGMESWQQQSRTYYRVRGPLVREWKTNQFVYDPGAERRRSHRAQTRGRLRDFGTDHRLSHRAQQCVGRHGAQSRTESGAESAHGPGNRLRHHVGARRHRQDLADPGLGARADAGSQPLQRNHHDPRHHSLGRGHRLPSRHRGGKNGALDGRLDGQSGGAHAEPTRAAAGDAAPPTICCGTESRSAR